MTSGQRLWEAIEETALAMTLFVFVSAGVNDVASGFADLEFIRPAWLAFTVLWMPMWWAHNFRGVNRAWRSWRSERQVAAARRRVAERERG